MADERKVEKKNRYIQLGSMLEKSNVLTRPMEEEDVTAIVSFMADNKKKFNRYIENTTAEQKNNNVMFFSRGFFQLTRLVGLDELNLPHATEGILSRMKFRNVNELINANRQDFVQPETISDGTMNKHMNRFMESMDKWVTENGDCIRVSDTYRETVQPFYDILCDGCYALTPFMQTTPKEILWMHIFNGKTISYDSNELTDINGKVQLILNLSFLKNKIINSFYSLTYGHGVATKKDFGILLKELNLQFDPNLIIQTCLKNNILTEWDGHYMITRQLFHETLEELNRTNPLFHDLLIARTGGADGETKTLEKVSQSYNVSRQRIDQRMQTGLSSMPMSFEDYFKFPLEVFEIKKDVVFKMFPEITEEVYNYFHLRYHNTRHRADKPHLTKESIAQYNGPWKNRLSRCLEQEEKDRMSEKDVILQVLKNEPEHAFTVKALCDRCNEYIKEHDIHVKEKLVDDYNMEARLSRKKCLYDKNRRIRYLSPEMENIWEKIDITRYNNMILSTLRIFRDYPKVMKELDIRDEHELYYVLIHTADKKNCPCIIQKRRVPVLAVGKTNEKKQVLSVLDKMPEITVENFKENYEKEYGFRTDTIFGNEKVVKIFRDYCKDHPEKLKSLAYLEKILSR